MSDITEIKRFGEHKNAFGALRLLFASLVIVAHTPEIIDGNRSREILTRIFGSISFGDLAVDAFFVISGFLITDSFVKRPMIRDYLTRRIARIYPAFIVASLICLFVVSPLGAGQMPLSVSALAKSIVHALLLMQPDPTQRLTPFPGTHYPLLNGAAWTIAYEFRCYLLVMTLGCIGLFSRRTTVLTGTIAILLAFAIIPGYAFGRVDALIPGHFYWWGTSQYDCRLIGVFLVGSLYFLYQDRVRFTKIGALASVLLLLLSLILPPIADAGTAVFGGYLIFFVAKRGGDTFLKDINNRNDISYGIYLYGWPVEKLLAWYLPGLSLGALGAATLALAAVLGWASWHGIERPVMIALRSSSRRQVGLQHRSGDLLGRSVTSDRHQVGVEDIRDYRVDDAAGRVDLKQNRRRDG